MRSAYIIPVLAFVLGAVGNDSSAQEHLNPDGKPPSKHTIAVLDKARAELPFSGRRDFD